MTKFFSSLKEREETLIFYESPKRIIETLLNYERGLFWRKKSDYSP